MKRLFFLCIIFGFITPVLASENCSYYKKEREYYYNKWLYSSYSDKMRSSYYSDYNYYKKKYNNCYDEFKNKFDLGYINYENGNYLVAIKYYKEALLYIEDNSSAKSNLYLSYLAQGNLEFDKQNYTEAIDYYKKGLDVKINDSSLKKNIALAYLGIGNNRYDLGKYEMAVSSWEQCFKYVPNYSSAKDNIKIAYKAILRKYENLGQYKNAINAYEKMLKLYGRNFAYLYNIGVYYEKLSNYIEAKKYYKESLEVATNKKDLELAKKAIEDMDTNQENERYKKEAYFNDIYSYLQYYLRDLSIDKAKTEGKTKYIPIVAVVDDGVHINHPDLTNNIWVNSDEIPGNDKDDDNNGFVDDYNGWNFVYNSNNILPLGQHGTRVAGIIGAQSNNKSGITGIAQKVKVMPVGVCKEDGTCKNIIQGIDYAIDNGANIVNISITGSQFQFSNEYEKIVEKAYKKGVILVVSAGNGDLLSASTQGVNTTVNKLSPICSDLKDFRKIIGVGALDKKGYRAKWSNYGECVDFFAPGEEIFSTSTILFSKKEYNTGDGTSFSSPILTGIIALGYNKFGKIDSDIVYDLLKKSSVKNSVGNYQIDAVKYLENIENSFDNIEKSKKISQILEKNYKYNKFRLEKLLFQLNAFKDTLSDSKKELVQYTIYILGKKI